MPSKNMLPKGKRRQSVRADYRAARTLAQERDATAREAAQARGEDVAGENTVESEEYLLQTADFMEYEKTLEERIAANDWITTKGASGSKVAEETHEAPRYSNPYAALQQPVPAGERDIQVLDDVEAEDGVRSFMADPVAAGLRLDAYLARALPDVSRSRVQTLIEGGQVRVDGVAVKAKHKLKGGEQVEVEGEPQLAPLRAEPEDLPLDVVYEDKDLAVVNKTAGMMVHAGAGGAEHNRGTLVNALLFHFGKLSGVGGDLRPGIVHRLDKDTSGLIVVAKNDSTHRKLSELFSTRQLRKVYLALVHGEMKGEEGTVTLPISRDTIRRTRMTTRGKDGRTAVTNWRVLERIDGPWGKFTLLEVHIETGRTHQIRVHMHALGHPVVGDTLYGAPARVLRKDTGAAWTLERNFLHAAELDFEHPRTGEDLELRAGLPEELVAALQRVRGEAGE